MNNLFPTQIVLANPRGFCAGVERAIEIVERALEIHGMIYVRHEVVHNKFVVDNLTRKGAVFVDDLDSIPENSTVVFSAHGVSQSVRREAAARKLTVFDATCPLVTKVHIEVRKYRKKGLEVLLIGHAGHPEVEGTMGQVDQGIHLIESIDDVETVEVSNPEKLAYVTQTTLSVDDTAKIIAALRARFPKLQGPHKEDICFATQNRQDAVKKLARKSDVVFVVGSPNSANSNRLREIAELRNVSAYLIDGPEQIQREWLVGKKIVGVTAGASAPESQVQKVIQYLSTGCNSAIELKGPEENLSFSLPPKLRKIQV